jgi:hypothetical protein
MANPYNTLSVVQIESLARIRHARKLGFLPSLNDCDTLLAITNQLLAPPHTCVDRPNLPCAGCGEEERKSA